MNNVWAVTVLCFLLCMDWFPIKDGGTWYGFLYQMKTSEQGIIYSFKFSSADQQIFFFLNMVELFFESW